VSSELKIHTKTFMHRQKIVVCYKQPKLMCDTDYQCTSVRFIKLSNRLESKNRFISVNLIVRLQLFFPESECSNCPKAHVPPNFMTFSIRG